MTILADTGPAPPAATLEASLNAADITNKISASSAAALKGSESVDMKSSSELAAYLTEALQSGRINNIKEVQDILSSFQHIPTTTTSTAEYTNEVSPPMPFNSVKYEDDADAIAKKKARDEMNQKPAAITNNEVVTPPSNRDSIYEPSRELIEGSEGMSDNTNTGRGNTNRRGWEDIESRAARRDIESQTRTNDAEANAVPTSTSQGLPEIEAYLVEDIEEEEVEVYMATPTLPWWKQRRTKILLGVVLVIVATLSIALGVSLSNKPEPVTNTETVFATNTTAPSLSLAPSLSSAPSSSPTECVDKIISNKQEIDLKEHLLIDNPYDVKIAVDGQNMVVVALDGKYYSEIRDEGGHVNDIKYDGPAYITFYTLNNNNDEWQREQAPFRVDNVGYGSSVAMSGDTAFIGFGRVNNYTGDVLNYEQDRFGEWVRMDDPFVHTANTTQDFFAFGIGVDVDGDLACVGSDGGDYIHLYHRTDDSKWVQFDTIEYGSTCSISGHTIAVDRGDIQLYKYNQDQNEVVPIQGGQISVGYFESIDLNKDYLVYWEQDVFVHHSNEINRTFSFHQKLNIGPFSYDENQLALDDDILVVGDDNHTYLYSLQGADWGESITLDESFDNIKISGRTLLATKRNETSLGSELYSYNIQDCTQDMPTQSPTLSPSLPPTVSSLPTTTFRFRCFHANDGGHCARYDISYNECVVQGVLYNAVRAYVDQGCATNQECDIAQVYGWPMNLWCVGSVKDMSRLFSNMDTFNEDINGWNTSSVTSMQSMFWGATNFNGTVSNFNTSRVTDMTGMFYDASSFSGQGVSNFDTSIVTNMNFMFNGATAFNGDVSSFNTSIVTNMYSMFYNALSFNGDVSNFNTSSVNNMDNMFDGAISFNGDVSNFDTTSVWSMRYMFYGATSFNKDLCSWQDSFRYNNAGDMFTNTNCTYQDTPQEAQKGPFCASDCGSSPSMSPTSSLAPTTSPKPTQSPTVSSSPTETCYWVGIVVVFDGFSDETSWDIQSISDSGNVVLKTFNGTSSEANKLLSESMCLEEGEYQFTIYDSYGDGISDPGYYNVTSDGKLIVKGGDFDYSESTTFSIPYEPPIVLDISAAIRNRNRRRSHTNQVGRAIGNFGHDG